MVRTVIAIGGVVLAIYLGFGALLYAMQRSQQYFPSGSIEVPEHLADRGVRRVAIPVEDGIELAAWHRAADPGRPLLLYFPGNGGSVADSHDRFVRLSEDGFGFLGVNYRGYPGSSGTPSERGLYADGLAAFDWLAERHGEDRRIIVYGWSLGSGVAAHVASRRDAVALVLESPFTSALDVARAMYPLYPVSWLMKDQYRTDRVVPAIAEPLVVLHGTADRTIPVDHGRALVKAHSGPNVYLEFDGGSHVDLWDRGAWSEIRAALERLGVVTSDR